MVVGGANFVSSTSLRCKFGTVSGLAATWVSITQVQCTSPALSASNVSVSISNNNQDYANSTAVFQFQPIPTVSLLQPTAGPAAGGTSVTVTGTNFVSVNVFCRFGSTRVAVQVFTSPTRIVCVAPSGTAGTTSFEVTLNNQDFTSTGMQYLYHPDATVTGVAPPNGPPTGATNVTVSGTNFVNTAALQCRFGTAAAVVASFMTTTSVMCMSPSTTTPGQVALEVTNNGNDYTTSNVLFRYNSNSTIGSIYPSFGWLSGGTTVELYGTNFVNSGLLRCRFGSLSPVSAVYVSATTMQCTTPAASVPGNVTLSMSNAQNYVFFGDFFQYGLDANVTAVAPSYGSQIGGTITTVTGNNFVPNNQLFCPLPARR